MNTNRVSKSNRLLSKAIAFFMVVSVFSLGFILFPEEVQAASGSIKVKSAKWTKKSIDTTTSVNAVIKLKVNAKNTVSGSNKLQVTIQNSKTKKKISTYIGKKGGTAIFSLTGNNLKVGTWKLVSVSAVKRSSSGSKWNSNTARWEPTYKNKKLKTVKRSKPSVKITRGVDTKLTLSMPSSVSAASTIVPVSATLKTAKGKAVKGAKVTFLIANSRNGEPTTTKATVTTNASGIATANISVPRETNWSDSNSLMGFAVKAQYKGKAKSYVASVSSVVRATQPKVKTKLLELEKISNGYRIQLVTNDGKNTPVAGFPLRWNIPGCPENINLTDSQGYSTILDSDYPDRYLPLAGKKQVTVGTGGLGTSQLNAGEARIYGLPATVSINELP